MNENEIDIYKDTSRGSLYLTEHTERKVKIYPLSEPEIKSIAAFNRLTVLFSSIGTGLAGFVLSAGYDVIKEPKAVENWHAIWPIWLILSIISGASYCIAHHYSKEKTSVLEELDIDISKKSEN